MMIAHEKAKVVSGKRNREIYLGEQGCQVWADGSEQERLHLKNSSYKKFTFLPAGNLTSTLSPRLVTRVQEVSSLEID